MANLRVHIGAHKSASTTVQDTLVHHSNLLLENGVLYPHGYFKKYPSQHSELYAKLSENDFQAVTTCLHDWSYMAEEKQAGTVVLSGEDLSAMNEQQLRLFDCIAKAFFQNIDYFLFVRDRDTYLISHYRHQLHAVRGRTPSSFRDTVTFSPKAVSDMYEKLGLALHIRPFVASNPVLIQEFVDILVGKPGLINVDLKSINNKGMDILFVELLNIVFAGARSQENEQDIDKHKSIYVTEVRKNSLDIHYHDYEKAVLDDLLKGTADNAWLEDKIDWQAIMHKDSSNSERKQVDVADKLEVLRNTLDQFLALKRAEESVNETPG